MFARTAPVSGRRVGLVTSGIVGILALDAEYRRRAADLVPDENEGVVDRTLCNGGVGQPLGTEVAGGTGGGMLFGGANTGGGGLAMLDQVEVLDVGLERSDIGVEGFGILWVPVTRSI